MKKMQVLATKADFDKVLDEAGDKLVVVDFTATWCGPCQRIAPDFAALADEFKDVVFVKVDVDDNAETAQCCDVSAMPTFQFFKNKSKVNEMTGANKDKLRELVLVLKLN